jgi:hypothetical protein
MIEELTPQVLMISMYLIIITAPAVTLLISMLLLWKYRRAVAYEMAAAGGFLEPAEEVRSAGSLQSGAPKADKHVNALRSSDFYRQAISAPWYTALQFAVSGLAFALVFAIAAHFVYPAGLGLPGFLIAVWIYAWPVCLALPLIVPGSMRLWAMCVVVYLAVFVLLGLWGTTIDNLPAYRFGAVVLPARSSVTPAGLMRLWLTVNGGPTLLVLCCFNHWVRAVAPLVLALVTTAITGTLAAVFALFSAWGVDAVVALSASLNVHVIWFVLATYLLPLAGFGAVGWVLMRWIARAYRRRKSSDQSLMLDALCLLFASTYSMWLVWGGLAWIATAPVAFLVYKLVSAAVARLPRQTLSVTPGLTFLRVFSLGQRSNELFGYVSRHWRYIGSVQMITGPDVAVSTVQPHQFLDFLSGSLSRHFVRDRASLERSLAERDRTPDPDGRFRINNLFCHADSWQPALPQLVHEGDTVLMDLRSFSAASAGCIHELRYLLQEVPIGRCLLVVDETTDTSFLERTLNEEWQRLLPGSPNHGEVRDNSAVYHLGSGSAPLRRLVLRLCEAASG